MRRLFVAMGGLAIVLCAASSAMANGPLEIILNNEYNGGGYWLAPFTSSLTQSDGALWIGKKDSGANHASQAPVLLDENVNIMISANIPNQGWTTIGTALFSQGTAAEDVTANDFGPPYPYGGYFTVENSATFTSNVLYSSNPGSIQCEVWAWTNYTGNYNTPAAAEAHGEYVGDSGVFLQPVGWGSTQSLGLSNMPATILESQQVVPEPNQATLLGTLAAALLGLAGYRWRRFAQARDC